MDSLLGILFPVAGIAAALVVGAFVILIAGTNPLTAYASLLDGAFGDVHQIADGLNLSTPYLIAGLGVAVAFRAGVFNVGGEGQIALGGLAATAVALAIPDFPGLLHIPLLIIVGAVAGGLWASIAALTKLFRGVHEVIVTLLMNFIAILLVRELLNGPLEEPGMGFPQSPMLTEDVWLPLLVSGTVLHAGSIFALVLALLVFVVLWRTPWGFDIRTLGLNPLAARYAGVHTGRAFFSAMFVSGMLGGVAGVIEVLGVHYRLIEGFSEGFGFDAIAVALIGAINPLGVIPAALFFGFLQSGASSMQRDIGVPSTIVPIIQGLAIVFVMVSLAIRVRPSVRRWFPEGEAEDVDVAEAEVRSHGS